MVLIHEIYLFILILFYIKNQTHKTVFIKYSIITSRNSNRKTHFIDLLFLRRKERDKIKEIIK